MRVASVSKQGLLKTRRLQTSLRIAEPLRRARDPYPTITQPSDAERQQARCVRRGRAPPVAGVLPRSEQYPGYADGDCNRNHKLQREPNPESSQHRYNLSGEIDDRGPTHLWQNCGRYEAFLDSGRLG